ncbi:MAG: tetratricopeptide repeat protein [Peptococcaceae bacterium]|jgi:tetratricopeptide (TPR) repeat protein|nr:tetratricopeptide repeat protein [Peptococcaceae bacterium]
MKAIHYDPEVLYMYKLHYLLCLVVFSLISGVAAYLIGGKTVGVVTLLGGIVVSYLSMLLKTEFKTPDEKIAAKRIAREILAKDASPATVSRLASQLHYYFQKTEQAVVLLTKYLSGNAPVIYVTLADILQKKGKPKQALSILRTNPQAFFEPMLLASQGYSLKQLGEIQEAIQAFERCCCSAKKHRLPHNGSRRLTQWLTELSYMAFIHHALAECYWLANDFQAAKRHYFAGNIRLLDITLWRFKPRQAPVN